MFIPFWSILHKFILGSMATISIVPTPYDYLMLNFQWYIESKRNCAWNVYIVHCTDIDRPTIFFHGRRRFCESHWRFPFFFLPFLLNDLYRMCTCKNLKTVYHHGKAFRSVIAWNLFKSITVVNSSANWWRIYFAVFYKSCNTFECDVQCIRDQNIFSFGHFDWVNCGILFVRKLDLVTVLPNNYYVL